MTPICLNPDKVETIVMACCILHNFLRSKVESSSVYTPPGSIDKDIETHAVHPGEWHEGPQSTGLLALAQQAGNRHSNSAEKIRDELCHYFVSDIGSLPWQWNMV